MSDSIGKCSFFFVFSILFYVGIVYSCPSWPGLFSGFFLKQVFLQAFCRPSPTSCGLNVKAVYREHRPWTCMAQHTSSGERHLHGICNLLLLSHTAEVWERLDTGFWLSLGRLQPGFLWFCNKPYQIQSVTDAQPSHALSKVNIQRLFPSISPCSCIF